MSDYYCDCSEDVSLEAVYDPCFIQEVTARKTHVCCECNEEIKPGDRYEYVKGLLCGRWEAHCTCLPCAAMRRDYCPEGYFFGFLGDSLFNCLGWSPYEVPDSDGE